MAWAHLKAAFNYQGDVSERALHVLLRIAFEMRGNDYVYAGTAYLAKKVNASRKTVQRALAELRDAGAILVESGRAAGHHNHYYLTIPGAPAPGAAAEGVGQNGPGEVGQNGRGDGPDVGQEGAAGWDRTDPERGYNTKQPEEGIPNRRGVSVPPLDGTVHKLPPTGTLEFKAYAIHFCYEAGATLEEARRFYESHEAVSWRVLERMPLEVAAEMHVNAWRKRDPRAYLIERLRRAKEVYP